jgi:hypothetical protein
MNSRRILVTSLALMLLLPGCHLIGKSTQIIKSTPLPGITPSPSFPPEASQEESEEEKQITREITRVQNIRGLQVFLEYYFADHGFYPQRQGFCSMLSSLASLEGFQSLEDPLENALPCSSKGDWFPLLDKQTPSYKYIPLQDGKEYKIILTDESGKEIAFNSPGITQSENQN